GYTGGYSVYSYNYAAGGGGSYFSSNGNYVGVNNNPGGYVVIHFIS
ncbi:MAG: fibronectin type III domain-containing protein, partial [Flavobacteriales bacterium]|nr:fibronectin type III domain-containing protein [Flavobacteriales bacterium]